MKCRMGGVKNMISSRHTKYAGHKQCQNGIKTDVLTQPVPSSYRGKVPLHYEPLLASKERRAQTTWQYRPRSQAQTAAMACTG